MPYRHRMKARSVAAAVLCSMAALSAALVMPSGAASAADAVPQNIADELRRIGVPQTAASFYVQPLDGARPVLSVNAEKPMNPASTMKLVTTYSALELLGPAFTWKTQLISVAPLKGDVLDGDLVIRGSGDPKLVLENFWLMLRELRARGVREIRGDVVLDHSLFDVSDYDPARFDGEPYRPYNVGPDALLVNFKAVTLRFVPDDERREIKVLAEPQLAGEQIAAPRYLDGACGDWRPKLAADFTNPAQISFAGGFPGSCGEKMLGVSVYSHTQYVGALFKALWGDAGGVLRGTVHDGPTPVGARVLVEHESPSLAEIVRDINKYSNNVMARQLYLALSAEILKLPANPDRAQRVIKTFLTGRGLAMPELVLENGSGLSRTERISALSMGRLLSAAWASPVMPELMASLSLVGYDGTMRRRLNAQSVAGQAHIKTGTLNDARAVAGYVLAASGRRYVAVAFINHANAGAASGVQDAFLQWVYEHG